MKDAEIVRFGIIIIAGLIFGVLGIFAMLRGLFLLGIFLFAAILCGLIIGLFIRKSKNPKKGIALFELCLGIVLLIVNIIPIALYGASEKNIGGSLLGAGLLMHAGYYFFIRKNYN